VTEGKFLTKAQMFALKLKQEVLTLPDIGDVLVREVSRDEVMELQGSMQREDGTVDAKALEIALLSAALIEPKLTPEDCTELYKIVGAGTIGLISDKIAQLSGLADNAAKVAVLAFRGSAGT
jgi:hypothetical protein